MSNSTARLKVGDDDTKIPKSAMSDSFPMPDDHNMVVTAHAAKEADEWLNNNKENTANKSTDVNLGTSDTLFPTQKAVKDYVDGKVPTTKGMWIDGVYKPNAFPASAKVTTSGGNAVVHFTNGGTSGGAPIFPNNIYLSTVQVNPYGTTNNLQPGARTLSNSNKTLTVEVRQTLLSLAILSLTTAANGLDCVITIWGD